jgi:hypothetical protein
VNPVKRANQSAADTLARGGLSKENILTIRAIKNLIRTKFKDQPGMRFAAIVAGEPNRSDRMLSSPKLA